MRIKSGLLLILSSIPSLSFSNSAVVLFYKQSKLIGPCQIGVTSSNVFSLTYYCNTVGTTEVFTLYSLPDMIKLTTQESISHTYDSRRDVVVCEGIYHIDSFMTQSGLYASLKIYSTSSGSVIYEIGRSIYPINPRIINVSQYKETVYKSKPFVIDFTKRDEGYETYDFTKVVDSIYNNSFSQLLINNMKFTYSSAYDFSYDNAYLTTSDPHNLFSHLKIDDIVKIPLKINKNGTSLTFSYDINSYINPTTLEMSHVFSSYFSKQTNKMYLPLNHKDELENYPFSIVVEKAGIEKNTLVFPLIYKNDVTILDNCVTSDFCVGGSVVL